MTDELRLLDKGRHDIPLITLTDVEGFRSAFETYGFGVLHQEDEILDAGPLRAAAYEFFRSATEYKEEYSSGGTYGPPGWAGKGLESVKRSLDDSDSTFEPDAVESFVYRGVSPTVPDILKDPLATYFAQATALLKRVMQATALSQGLDVDFFEPYFLPPSCTIRLGYYPAGNAPKYGPHTDYTGFTLLNAEKSGLQVWYDNQWVDVPCVADRLVVNAGDLLPIWTNGRFRSALHQVVATEETATADRLSIVFFTGPSDDALVEPIVLDGETPSYEAVISGEHLRSKLASTNRQ